VLTSFCLDPLLAAAYWPEAFRSVYDAVCGPILLLARGPNPECLPRALAGYLSHS